jgi:hypothetical protein
MHLATATASACALELPAPGAARVEDVVPAVGVVPALGGVVLAGVAVDVVGVDAVVEVVGPDTVVWAGADGVVVVVVGVVGASAAVEVVGVDAVAWAVVWFDAPEEDLLDEPPHAISPRQTSGTTSSVIVAATRLLTPRAGVGRTLSSRSTIPRSGPARTLRG